MSLRWSSLDTLPERYQRSAREQLGLPSKPRKYRNEPVTDPDTGARVDSKREARVLADLRQRLRSGELRWLARQVELQLTASRRMVVDFLVCDRDGKLHWLDAKGHATADWKTKAAIARDLHGIEVEAI